MIEINLEEIGEPTTRRYLEPKVDYFVDDLYGPILSVTQTHQADQYFRELVDWMMSWPDSPQDREQVERRARDIVGCWTRWRGVGVWERVERLFHLPPGTVARVEETT